MLWIDVSEKMGECCEMEWGAWAEGRLQILLYLPCSSNWMKGSIVIQVSLLTQIKEKKQMKISLSRVLTDWAERLSGNAEVMLSDYFKQADPGFKITIRNCWT